MNKICTDIEQSRKLAKILPLESADMWYWEWPTAPKYNNYERPMFHRGEDIVNVPCWSLAALLEQFEDTAGLAKDYGLWFCYDNRKSYCTKHYNNPVDACYEMIVKLKEENLI